MKKLPFKPTALRKLNATPTTPAAPSPGQNTTTKKSASDTPAKEDDDGLDLFRRAKEMAPIVAADREERIRRKQRKAEKEKEAERRTMRLSEPRTSPQGKRALQEEEEDVLPVENDDEQAFGASPTDDETKMNSELVTPPPSKRTRTREGSSIKRSTRSASKGSEVEPDASPLTRRSMAGGGSSNAPFVLESDPEDSTPAPVTRRRRRRSSSVQSITEQNTNNDEDNDDNEDEDVKKYIRMAEENRAKMLAQQSAGSNAKPRKVEILINSPIPGARPCQIKYFFDKPLFPVRKAWIDRQHGADLPEPDELILTWRCNKVYNNSSLLDLGIRPWGEYGVFADGGSSSGLDGTKVHLQIWTAKLLEEHLAAEQLRRKREAGEISDDDEDNSELQSREPVEERRRFKVNLRARDYDEVGLTVLPETTVETLLIAFRAQRSIPEDKEVSLRFDGDQLEEQITMEEAGVDEMDTIEVHIK